MRVLIVIRRGVYRHKIIGVFEELDEAIAAGHEAVQTEDDHYHAAEVVACTVGGGTEEVIGEVTAVWEGTPRVYKGTCWIGYG